MEEELPNSCEHRNTIGSINLPLELRYALRLYSIIVYYIKRILGSEKLPNNEFTVKIFIEKEEVKDKVKV